MSSKNAPAKPEKKDAAKKVVPVAKKAVAAKSAAPAKKPAVVAKPAAKPAPAKPVVKVVAKVTAKPKAKAAAPVKAPAKAKPAAPVKPKAAVPAPAKVTKPKVKVVAKASSTKPAVKAVTKPVKKAVPAGSIGAGKPKVAKATAGNDEMGKKIPVVKATSFTLPKAASAAPAAPKFKAAEGGSNSPTTKGNLKAPSKLLDKDKRDNKLRDHLASQD